MDPFPSRKPRLAFGITLKVILFLALCPVVVAGCFVAGRVLSTLSHVLLDLSIDEGGLLPGALVSGAASCALVFSLLFGRKRLRWLSLFLCLIALAATVAYSVHYRTVEPFEYLGSSAGEIEELLRKRPTPPELLLSIEDETRPVRFLGENREVLVDLVRKGGKALSLGIAVPEPGEHELCVQVDALLPDGTRLDLFRTPPLRSGRWNDFTLPASYLPRSNARFALRLSSEEPAEVPWVFVSAPRAETMPQGPNVILICVDTFRADMLEAVTMPFLAGLMKSSSVFTQAMAPSSWTVPATASILSGVYPHEHGYISNALMRFKAVEMLPEQFRKAGYKTAAISSNRLIDPRFSFGRGFEQFISLGRQQRNYLNSGRILTLRAMDWLRANKAGTFFLYLHYNDLHYPYLALPPDTFLTLEGGWLTRLRSLYSCLRYDSMDFTNLWLMAHPEAVPLVISRYQGEMRYWDRQFEMLINFLGQEKILANTLVIVVGDHGEAFGEHGNYRHGASLFEEEVHVPLVLFDGRYPRGLEIDLPVSTTEVAPIIAERAGISPAASWAGRNLSQLVSGQAEHPLGSLLLYKHFIPMMGVPTDLKVSLAARAGGQKIILDYDPRTQATTPFLFNLAQDPGEKINLWDQSAKHELELYQWLVDFMPEPEEIIELAPAETDQQLLKDLKALGYVK